MKSKKKLKKKKKNLKTTLQNLWDETKAVLRGKSIAIDAFLKKQTNKKSIKNYLNLSPLETTKRTKETQIHQKEENNTDQKGNK